MSNYNTIEKGKGMPLGNLTSQFFANVYLNKLDHYVKHELRTKYYVRYVDDFVIIHHSKKKLEIYKQNINDFLKEKLTLELHPEKSKIFSIQRGTEFLGFKIFPHHRLLKKKNLRKFKNKLNILCKKYKEGLVNYDNIYDFLEGRCVFTKNANTYNLKKRILPPIEKKFKNEVSTKEVNHCLKNKFT